MGWGVSREEGVDPQEAGGCGVTHQTVGVPVRDLQERLGDPREGGRGRDGEIKVIHWKEGCIQEDTGTWRYRRCGRA